MDELKLRLSTKFMKGIVGNIISKAIRKKLGCGVDVCLNDIEVKNEGGRIILHADIDAMMKSEDLPKLIKTIGLD